MSDRDVVQAPRDIADNSVADDSMMASLVIGKGDVIGLLAYSMYVQSRDEWRTEFNEAFGREPNAHEMKVYELGEQTARRKITYRFLADARLTGTYANTHASNATHAFVQKVYEASAKAAVLRRSALVASMSPTVKVVGILTAFALGTALPLTVRLLH